MARTKKVYRVFLTWEMVGELNVYAKDQIEAVKKTDALIDGNVQEYLGMPECTTSPHVKKMTQVMRMPQTDKFDIENADANEARYEELDAPETV